MTLTRLAVRKPVATSMAALAVALLGGVALLRLPVGLLPEIAPPTLTVWSGYPEAGPLEVERLVTEPVERAVGRVPGVKQVGSVSREAVSEVRVRFFRGVDMDLAALAVREQLDAVRDLLPRGVARPAILRGDPAGEPIAVLAVASEAADLAELSRLSETVFTRRLEQIKGIARVAVAGAVEREIRVLLDPARLEASGSSIEAVARALAAANYSAPGGAVRRGYHRYTLSALGAFRDVREIAGTVVASGADGAAVVIGDLGTVEDDVRVRQSVARYNGRESVGLLLYGDANANTVRATERVQSVVSLLRHEYPRLQISVVSAQATVIREALTAVAQALALGAALAFLVLFLFLRDVRYPLAISLAMPLSVLFAFGLLHLAGVGLNVMSLGGLALGVGMMVDNSIVVLENISRTGEAGLDPARAAVAGTRQVRAAITASTLTTVAVFAPIIYVKGAAARLFADFSVAVTASLFASLGVAITVLPMLAARMGRRTASGASSDVGAGLRRPRVAYPAGTGPLGSAGGWESGRFYPTLIRGGREADGTPERASSGGTSAGRARSGRAPRVPGRSSRARRSGPTHGAAAIVAAYERALRWALAHRRATAVCAAAVCAAALYAGWRLPRDFLPAIDGGGYRLSIGLPVGTPLELAERAVARAESVLLRDETTSAVFSRIGPPSAAEASGFALRPAGAATLEVALVPGVRALDALAEVRSRLEGRLGGSLLALEGVHSTDLHRRLGAGDADVAVRVHGDDLDATHRRARDVADRLSRLPMLADVRVGFRGSQPAIEVEVDRVRAARHGLTVRRVADAIASFMRGLVATRLRDFDRKTDVVVRPVDEARRRLDGLLDSRVGDVPISEVVRWRQVAVPTEVRRAGGRRVVPVHARVSAGGLAAAVAAIDAELGALEPRVRYTVAGLRDEMRESFRAFRLALLLATVLVFMILAAQFESVVDPLIVFVTVPIGAAGAAATLAVAGRGIDVISSIGGIIMVGIVVNDAIIKLDLYRRYRRRGAAPAEVVLEAGRARLRPIVMTTTTTVLGLAPLALGLGAGSHIAAPLALTVIGGLVLATALTLFAVPVLYTAVEERRRRDASPGARP